MVKIAGIMYNKKSWIKLLLILYLVCSEIRVALVPATHILLNACHKGSPEDLDLPRFYHPIWPATKEFCEGRHAHGIHPSRQFNLSSKLA